MNTEQKRLWTRRRPANLRAKREYDRCRYQENRGQIKSRIYQSREPKREIRRQAIAWYLQSHPCADCGEADLLVLEFDHIPGRGERIRSPYGGLLLDGALSRLWEEIQKCEVVCANCHRRRSRTRGSFRRLVP